MPILKIFVSYHWSHWRGGKGEERDIERDTKRVKEEQKELVTSCVAQFFIAACHTVLRCRI